MGKLMINGQDASSAYYMSAYPESKDQIYDHTNAVNITSNNVQSAISELDAAIGDTTKIDGIGDGTIAGAIAELENVAKGATGSKVFDTFAAMETWLKDSANANTVEVGTHIYIKETDVSDYWVSNVLEAADETTGYYYEISQLETGSVNLDGYVTTDQLNGDLSEKLSSKAISLVAVDLNTVTTEGTYYVYDGNADLNYPSGINGLLLVFRLTENSIRQFYFRGGTIDSNDMHWYTRQIKIVASTGEETFGIWEKIISNSDLDTLQTNVDTISSNLNVKVSSFDSDTATLYLVSV